MPLGQSLYLDFGPLSIELGHVISRTRARGCSLPFFGGTGLFLIVLEAARAGLG